MMSHAFPWVEQKLPSEEADKEHNENTSGGDGEERKAEPEPEPEPELVEDVGGVEPKADTAALNVCEVPTT